MITYQENVPKNSNNQNSYFLEYSLTLFFPMLPFDPSENIRNPKVFWGFQGDQKGILGRKMLKENYALFKIYFGCTDLFCPRRFRSSRPGVFCKKGVLRNFAGKYLCQSLFFNKVARLRPATEHLRWLLLEILL